MTQSLLQRAEQARDDRFIALISAAHDNLCAVLDQDVDVDEFASEYLGSGDYHVAVRLHLDEDTTTRLNAGWRRTSRGWERMGPWRSSNPARRLPVTDLATLGEVLR